jgi:hypothetical protein
LRIASRDFSRKRQDVSQHKFVPAALRNFPVAYKAALAKIFSRPKTIAAALTIRLQLIESLQTILWRSAAQ